jgi:uncharacterized protein
MTLFIDADAFPNLLKPIVFRAIQREKLQTYVISNKKVSIGVSSLINYIIVAISADEADNKIVSMVQKNDLVLTADIPLADRVVSKNAYALDFKGVFYDEDNIKQHLVMRNLMNEIREGGEILKGPAPFGEKQKQSFANAFSKFLQEKK